MTLADLKTLCSSWLDDLQFGYFTEAQLLVWLNNGQRECQKRLINAGQNYYLKCVQTTAVVNQNDYVLPSDFKKLHRLEIVTSGTPPNETKYPVVPITLNQQDIVQRGSGAPAAYFLKKNRVYLMPAPDTTYTLRLFYSYQVTDMALATDVPDAPEAYHELIALLACQDGFLKDGRSAELLVKKISEFQAELDSDANERNQDMPRYVVQTTPDAGGEFIW